MAHFRVPFGLAAVVLAAGSVLSGPQQAAANPDDSPWYQSPAQARQAEVRARQAEARARQAEIAARRQASVARNNHNSHRSSGFRISSHSGSRYGSHYSTCPTTRYGYGYSSRTYRSSSYYPRYSSHYRYSSPTVISYPSTSRRITYVTPVVEDTRYSSDSPSGAYDAVSYREYQRLLAEQRVLRQQVLEMEREQAAASAPTYNPGPPVPSKSPLNIAKESGDSAVKPDRPKSETEILPPVPNERSIRADAEGDAADTPALSAAWQQLAEGNFPASMGLFSELAGQETASTADRIGFALAAASIGQREHAAWAMRRVLVGDPEGFGFIPASDDLRTTLRELSSTIARDAEVLPQGPEYRMLMFLVASIDYLSMDMESGLERLDKAQVDGADHHQGAVQLRRLLEESGATGF